MVAVRLSHEERACHKNDALCTVLRFENRSRYLDITFVVESTTIELVGNDGVAKGYGQNRVG